MKLRWAIHFGSLLDLVKNREVISRHEQRRRHGRDRYGARTGRRRYSAKRGSFNNEYLQTEPGHAIADRLVTLLENKQQQTIKKVCQFQTWVLVAQIVVFVTTLGVLTFLSYRGKVDPTLALLIGTLVGYFFRKRPRQ